MLTASLSVLSQACEFHEACLTFFKNSPQIWAAQLQQRETCARGPLKECSCSIESSRFKQVPQDHITVTAGKSSPRQRSQHCLPTRYCRPSSFCGESPHKSCCLLWNKHQWFGVPTRARCQRAKDSLGHDHLAEPMQYWSHAVKNLLTGVCLSLRQISHITMHDKVSIK